MKCTLIAVVVIAPALAISGLYIAAIACLFVSGVMFAGLVNEDLI